MTSSQQEMLRKAWLEGRHGNLSALSKAMLLEGDDLRNDLKLGRFAIQRVLTARDTFLQH